SPPKNPRSGNGPTRPCSCPEGAPGRPAASDRLAREQSRAEPAPIRAQSRSARRRGRISPPQPGHLSPRADPLSELSAIAARQDDLRHQVPAPTKLGGYLVWPESLLVIQECQPLLLHAPWLPWSWTALGPVRRHPTSPRLQRRRLRGIGQISRGGR